MASPVTTTVKHFMSEMEGAPVLNGVAGSFIGLLDACLVTGFALKAATSLAVAGGVATLTFAGSHGATVGSVVLVEGVTGALAALNGEQRVTVLGTGQVKFATSAPDGTATGAVTFKLAPAGWTKAFSGTNLAAYRIPSVEGTRMFLRVNDAGKKDTRLVGYENMTGISTGSGPFPTNAQISGGGYLCKSADESATPVQWAVVADDRGVFFSVGVYGSISPGAVVSKTYYFGDIEAWRTGGDPYACALFTALQADSYTTVEGTVDGGSNPYVFFPRGFAGVGGSAAHTVRPEIGSWGAISGTDQMQGAYPNAIDGGLRLSRRLLSVDSRSAVRGVVPGVYSSPQSEVGMHIAPRSILQGDGPLSGRKLLALGAGSYYVSYPSASLGISFVDVTGPWVR